VPVYRRASRLPHDPARVFEWHTRPGALERLLPPWEDVRILDRTGALAEGTRVRLRIRRAGVPLTWEVEHTRVDAPRLFRDEQVSGPFRSWTHAHRFRPGDEGGCVVEDEVEWEAPLGAAGRPFARPVVERALDRMFAFRHRRLAHDLQRLEPHRAEPRLRVAVTGASGLVGRLLVPFLRAGGHEVIRLVRSREAARADDAVYWSVEEGEIDAPALEGLDAAVHLAGESIFALRWTEAKKRAILESRRRGTRLLAEALAGLDGPPGVLVSASGVDFYGDRGDEILTEDAASGESFLARVCREWERATRPAWKAGIRVVTLRTAMVLTPAGGALGAMLPAFRAGLGGRIGSGRQYMSWIDADDHVALIHHALRRSDLEGPVNASSPHPVTNAAFTDALGRVLGRPTLLPLPSPAVKLALGDMGGELLLQGRRVVPDRALEAGFRFLRPGIEDALRHQLGRADRSEAG